MSFTLAAAWAKPRQCPCNGDDHWCPNCAEDACPRCGDDLDPNWYCSEGYCPNCCEETDNHEDNTEGEES